MAESVELNASLYLVSPNGAPDGGPPLRVATTSNGADWTELSVSLPVSNISVNELVAFANQIWLFGGWSTDILLLKSSDGATWYEVATPAWETSTDGVEIVATPDRLFVLAPLSGVMGTYVWSTTDGSTWTQSSEVIPSVMNGGVEVTYANGALWTFGTPEGEMDQALYKSTDWGNSWSQVTTNLSIQQGYDIELMALAPSPGLLYASGYSAYISEDGSDWSKVSATNYEDFDVSSTGKFWVTESINAGTDNVLHSIGGPLRNGRFFYYQKD
jgi:hypothetical protein